MRPLTPLLLLATLSAPAHGQLNLGDDRTVTQIVERYHAALAAGDTTAVKGMLAPGATRIQRGEVVKIDMPIILGEVRWERAITRDSIQRKSRVMGWSAVVISTSKVASRGNPALLSGTEAESIVLSKFVKTWFIEVIHTSLGSTN